VSAVIFGSAAGIVLVVVALVFGFWGFLLVGMLGIAGGVCGAVAAGRLDLRAALNAATGRRVG
jgi:hypothetical protein